MLRSYCYRSHANLCAFQVSQESFNQLYQNLYLFQSLGYYHNVLKRAGDLEAWKGKLYHLDKLYFVIVVVAWQLTFYLLLSKYSWV